MTFRMPPGATAYEGATIYHPTQVANSNADLHHRCCASPVRWVESVGHTHHPRYAWTALRVDELLRLAVTGSSHCPPCDDGSVAGSLPAMLTGPIRRACRLERSRNTQTWGRLARRRGNRDFEQPYVAQIADVRWAEGPIVPRSGAPVDCGVGFHPSRHHPPAR